MKLSKVLCFCGTALSAAIIFVEGEKISTCRTRFSFDRPTRDDILSTLFGGREPSGAERSVSFNHGAFALEIQHPLPTTLPILLFLLSF